MQVFEPTNGQEIKDIFGDRSLKIGIRGYGSKASWSPVPQGILTTRNLNRILDFSPSDHRIEVETGAPLAWIQDELKKKDQCLPLLPGPAWAEPMQLENASIGGALSCNFPHPYECHFGSWKQWVMEATAVLPNRSEVHCGSKVVKNVAGFDLHKLFVGAWGSLGVVTKVTLRTYPVRLLPKLGAMLLNGNPVSWIQRVPRSNFNAAEVSGLVALDPETCTVWSSDLSRKRVTGDWVLARGNQTETSRSLTSASKVMQRRLEALVNAGQMVGGDSPWRVT